MNVACQDAREQMGEGVPGNSVNFAHSSRAFALLGEVLVKLGQITRSSAEIANPPGFRPYLL